MANKDIIVIGASLGGIEVLKELVSGLPQNLPASVFIVQHIAPDGPGLLPHILAKAGPLPVSHPTDKEPIKRGHIYVAPPDYHLLVDKDFVRLTRGPKENRSRPSIDALFRAAAYSYGTRTIGVVLTGLLDDGMAGLWAVKDRGGLAIVQDPEDAYAPSMPTSALQNVEVDYCLRRGEIAPLLAHLSQTRATEEGGALVSDQMKLEVAIAKENTGIKKGLQDLLEPSNYTCPECHGVLLQLQEGTHIRFRCHTGHAYSVGSLLTESAEAIEDALWEAIRALEERILFLWQLADQHRNQHQDQAAEELLTKAQALQQKADIIRQVVMGNKD